MLDAIVHQEMRLRILAVLHRNREMTFGDLIAATLATEGNLGGHLERLQAAGYVRRRVALSARGLRHVFALTKAGEAALMAYIGQLRDLLGL